MKSSDYWTQRFEAIEQRQIASAEEYYQVLEREYLKASREIEQELADWYIRFAVNNNIDLVDARKLLNSKELAEFQWAVEDYIKYGQENATNALWMKQLENASTRVHISRLEALQIKLRHQVETLYDKQAADLDSLLRGIYADDYYRTAYEIQKGFNIGWNIQELNAQQLDKALSKPWTTDNHTFRDRCWTDKTSLVNTVQTELTQSIMRGDSPDTAIRNITKRFEVAKNKAGRLVMTESAYIASDAQEHCYRDLGVEEYELVATLDNKTSELCQELDGQVYPMSAYQIGVTAPPFHPWCRTTTVPHFDDNFTTRAARKADGSTEYVPGNIKYREWKKEYVLKPSSWNDIIGIETQDGLLIDNVKDHFLNQQSGRNVSVQAALDALKNPLHITGTKLNNRNEASVQYIGEKATVAVNPETGTVITTWKTGQARVRKYKGGG